VVKKEWFFDLSNPSLNENYPNWDDFARIVNDNWWTVDLNSANNKINEFIKFQLASNFQDKKAINIVIADVVPDINQSPVVTIEKIFWKSVVIKNSESTKNVFTRNQLYSSQTPLIIKDVNNNINNLHIEKLILWWIEHKVGDEFIKVTNDSCKITKIFEQWFAIECGYAETYNLISSVGLEKNIVGNILEFSWINNNSDESIFINDTQYSVTVEYVNKNRNIDNLLTELDNYISIDKSIVDDIKYKNSNFEIYFKSWFNWYIKSSPDYDVFLLFIISLK
jgi:hypothetical protein